MDASRASSDTLTVRVADDLVLNAGSWCQAVDQDQRPIADITPPAVPMFQQLADYLEAKPVPPAGYVRLADEARAAVAVCLRWGSYFAVLADVSRPFSPGVRDAEVSQISDDEMARMNIEISAAIEWWLMGKGSNEQRHTQLVQRALMYMPLGRKTVTRSCGGAMLEAYATASTAAQVRLAWPAESLEQDLGLAATHGVRAIANTIALACWRNGPIENVHAGRRIGYALNERRLLPRDEKAIVGQAQNVLYSGLQAMETMVFDNAWPPPAERVLAFMCPFFFPRGWSCTEQSRAVQIPVRPT